MAHQRPPRSTVDAVIRRVAESDEPRLPRPLHVTRVPVEVAQQMLIKYTLVLENVETLGVGEAEVLSRRSTLFSLLGMHEEALVDAETALELDPTYLPVRAR